TLYMYDLDTGRSKVVLAPPVINDAGGEIAIGGRTEVSPLGDALITSSFPGWWLVSWTGE
ncbi:MAG: hypothetical protein JXA33_04360, partial [Anaerolineae bacterium]|nr:hypothetical protein [Anaerolineae bacterium]